jgi:spermidine synthase
MTTREFFAIVYDHLTEDGVMVINIGRSPSDRRLIDGLVGTIKRSFRPYMSWMFPSRSIPSSMPRCRETEITNLYQNFEYLQTSGAVHPILLDAIQKAIVYQQPTPEKPVVFTDDWAPIEWITNNMVLEFVLFGEVEHLR